MAHCEVCSEHPCECDEAWLYRDERPSMSTAEFLEWYDRQGYGKFEMIPPTKIPWKELLQVVSAVLLFLGLDGKRPDDIARGILPMIRGSTTSARAREEG